MAAKLDLTVAVKSHQDTVAFGKFLGTGLSPGDLVLLTGDLGAGKTTLVGGVGEGLGVVGPILSPTFLTVRTHSLTARKGTFYHVDLYRIEDPWYLEGEGILEELEAGAIVVVEWAERAAGLEDFDPLEIALSSPSTGRSLAIRGSKRWAWVANK